MEGVEHILDHPRLSVVGVAKNCGKTTTLNALLQRRRALDLAPPSLVSIGIDGEARDFFLGTEKPSIVVQPGQWIASAQEALARSTATLEFVGDLGITTALGPVYICRVLEEGSVVLAGLRHRREVQRAVEALGEVCPAPIWIDGAYGRVIGAHPELARHVVVATGMVAGATVDEVVRRTGALVTRLGVAGIDDGSLREVIVDAVERDRALLVDGDGTRHELAHGSAVVGFRELSRWWTPQTQTVAVPGLVSDGVVEALLGQADRGLLLVPDPTVVQVADDLWRSFCERWEVRALHPVEVVAISYNPTCPEKGGVDARLLGQSLAYLAPEIPLFNPLQ